MARMDTPASVSHLSMPDAAQRPFERVSFSRQFMLVSSGLLVLAMLLVGGWISLEIERSAVNRAAAIAAVYVESILAAQLHDASPEELGKAETHAALDRIFNEGPLRRKVVRFKLWDPDGVIRYSSDHAQIGRRYPLDGMLAAAFAGTVQSHMTDLGEAEHAAERERWERLLEVYVPVRGGDNGAVVAVAEFYHATENISRDVQSAQLRSWALVAAATLAIFLLLFAQVRRANDTIRRQRNDLRLQLRQLRATFEENERMRARLGEAGAATTALNEQLLHRIAADLHDAPAQTLAFALMRFEELVAACVCCARPGDTPPPDLHAILAALRSSLDDLRDIAAGLGLPGIAELSLADTVRRALRDFERQTGIKVAAEVDAALPDAGLATKITVYRLLQESLANCRKHAGGADIGVRVWRDGDQMHVEVRDAGAGFDPQEAALSGRLGLAFMQERARLLGGHFELDSAPGRGTRVHAVLPLTSTEALHG
ncbi:MAG: sensor histidine kinase [Pseudomonadota bacterium]